MTATQRSTLRFQVGDWVSFRYGSRQVWAQVIEDRGSFGAERRRIYRIRLDQDAEEPVTFELPEDLLVAAALDRAAVLQYLNQGGLVSILRANLGGETNQPRVWLTLDSRGRVAHTFIADRGIIGGESVPFFALLEDRVFAAKENQVLDFLMSLKLTRAEAEDVIRSVGMAP
jgi:hypothetical protein